MLSRLFRYAVSIRLMAPDVCVVLEGKCGIEARELKDGIEIVGQSWQHRLSAKPNHVARVHCYDDHRIAMSFAVVGVGLP
jgi:5-enolpyruvylshikimate-3-phosphate synthase